MTNKGISNGLPLVNCRLFARHHTTDMEIRHERRILKRLAFWLAVCVLALVVSGQALADLPPPTPPAIVQTIANTSNGFPLSGGVTPDGRFSYSTGNPRPSPAQYESVKRALHGTNPDLLSGMKSHPIRLTDSYGNAARGQIRTATTMPSNGALAQGLGALVVADMANAHLNNLNAQGTADRFVRGLEQGDMAEVLTAVAQLADITGLGGNIYRTMTQNDIAPIHQQMQQQAQQMYQDYQSQPRVDPAAYAQYSVLTISQDHPANRDQTSRTIIVKGRYQVDDGWFIRNSGTSLSLQLRDGQTINYTFPPGNEYMILSYRHATYDTIAQHNARNTPQLADLIPSEAQMTQIMLQLLNDTNRNHTELINALVAGGKLDPSKQPTQVLGTPAQNTFLTEPFTPAGSNQAQQTQFVVNSDGSVTVSTINRPDLAANTSQAPTRAEVGQAAPSPAETRDAKQGSTAEKPDICAQNPNSLMCADLGSGDYTDPVLPNEQRSLDFNPADLFADTGTCPAPKQISVFTANIKLPYDPLCDMAGKLRPLIILLGMSTALFMVYGAVNNE